jgi:hypothetical protein
VQDGLVGVVEVAELALFGKISTVWSTARKKRSLSNSAGRPSIV